ncbi:hypothetical protein CCMA1212_003720 [Trichoderma ghanense]|uniref:Uncharacterized protein n=1 Tax=Trichoderma ghanense TaxID=65468 RepID=A0ABY2H931_9HYPO
MLHILASTWKVGVRLYFGPLAPQPPPPVSGSSSGPWGRQAHVEEELGQDKNGTHSTRGTKRKTD